MQLLAITKVGDLTEDRSVANYAGSRLYRNVSLYCSQLGYFKLVRA